MLPLELQTPAEILKGIADRMRALRLERGWAQDELAKRAGVSLATIRRFERNGQITTERLVAIAVVLDAVRPLGELFAPGPARTLDELEVRATVRRRAPRRRKEER